jgi:hypothetical protein
VTTDACAPVTRQLQVQGDTPWTDTGADVTPGTEVVIHATGKVRYGTLAAQITDPNGGNFDGQQFFATAVLPKAKVCSLIGRVGDAPVPNANGFVGADYDETMTASGRLFLGFNDQVGSFGDNSGAFDVTLTTTCGDR